MGWNDGKTGDFSSYYFRKCNACQSSVSLFFFSHCARMFCSRPFRGFFFVAHKLHNVLVQVIIAIPMVRPKNEKQLQTHTAERERKHFSMRVGIKREFFCCCLSLVPLVLVTTREREREMNAARLMAIIAIRSW